MPFLATDCARARESVSVQLDGELPEFDLDRLETHLRICPACTAWAEQVRGATMQLREAALESPEQRFVLPRGRRWSVSSAVALTAAAAVVATIFVAPARQHASLDSLAPVPPRVGATYDVAAGVVYPPHPLLGGMTLGVSVPIVATGPLRPL